MTGVKVLNTPMRWIALLACGCFTIPTFAADEAPTVDARTLGIAEAILNYCAGIDPAAADKYRQQVKMLVQGASEQTLTQVRGSEEYRKARASMEDFVGKVDEHNAKRVCSEAVAPSK
jgi:hypothetical protein